MFKNTSGQKFAYFAFDTTTGLPKTGDAANISGYLSKDWGTVTQLTDTSATEMDSTNAKGWYLFDVAQAETNADALLFTGKSSTSNISVVGQIVYSVAPNFTAFSLDSSGRVNLGKALDQAVSLDANNVLNVSSKYQGGTLLTARDIGLSVLVSSGTGTGQLDVTSGVVKANLVQILATALTETVGGYLAAAFKKLLDVATPVFTAASVNQTGDVYARLGAPAGASVSADIAAIKAVLPASFPTNFSALLISGTGHISNVDTLTTYTGNTVQTGDSYGRLGAPAGASVSADIAAVKATFPSNFASLAITAGGHITTVDTVTDLTSTTYAQPSGVIAATASIKDIILWMGLLSRNKMTTTATTGTILASDGTTTVSTNTVSDDGTTFTRGAWT